MLVTPRGDPIPPQSVVDRLAAVDERLTIKWVPSPATGPYWAIVERWPRGDARWQYVRDGVHGEDLAYDMLAMLPPDCSAEQAEGFILRKFARVTDPKKDAQQQVERVQKANDQRKVAVREAFLVEQEEKHARQTSHEMRVLAGAEAAHPMVSGVDLPATPKKVRRKTG